MEFPSNTDTELSEKKTEFPSNAELSGMNTRQLQSVVTKTLGLPLNGTTRPDALTSTRKASLSAVNSFIPSPEDIAVQREVTQEQLAKALNGAPRDIRTKVISGNY